MGSDVGEHGVRVVAFGVEIGVGIVFGDAPDAETLVPEGRPALRFYRTRAGLSQQDLAFRATVSHDVISKIETGERPPAGDFPPRLDAVPELDTRGALIRLWDHLEKGQRQRLYGWFQAWAGIEAQAELEPDLERDGHCYLIGDATDEAVLREAGIGRARGLICAVDSDAENVFITIVARSLSPALLIVARAAREQSADRLYRAGATHVVSPYVTSGRRMANLAVRPHVVEFFDVAGAGQPGLRLEELAITEGSPLAGGSLEELRGPAVP